MDMLKKYFPYSFGAKEITDLVVKIIVYVIVGAVAIDMYGRNRQK